MVKEIYYVTSNPGKARSLQNTLSGFGIAVKQLNLGLVEPQSHDVREIAIEKAKNAFKKIGKPCVVNDAGFYMDALNGFPGPLIRPILDTIGIEGILKLVEGKGRACEFRHCFAYMGEGMQEPVCFEDDVKGSLTESPLGELKENAWSRLFLFFVPEKLNRTLAQMSIEEYLRWHKGNADRAELELAAYLKEK